MEYFALYDTVRTYCETNNIKFLAGDAFYINAEASNFDYEDDQLVLTMDVAAKPTFSIGNKISDVTYTGLVMLGRKFETLDNTTASLDEKFMQKYDNRLKDLAQLLIVHITTIACANELEIGALDMRYALNKFDTNIDFIAGTISLIQ